MRSSTVRSALQLLSLPRSKLKPCGCAWRIVVSVFLPKRESVCGTSSIAWCVKVGRRTKSLPGWACRLCAKLSSNTAEELSLTRKRGADRDSVSHCRDSNPRLKSSIDFFSHKEAQETQEEHCALCTSLWLHTRLMVPRQ